MELAKVQMARSIWLFDTEELNPRGRKFGPILQAVKDRYHFREPLAIEDLKPQPPNNSFKFAGGTIDRGDIANDVELEIYNDGLVATSKSDTDHTDGFLMDLTSWLRQQQELRNENYAFQPKRAYRSEVVLFAPKTKLSSGIRKFMELAYHVADSANVKPEDIEAEAIIFGSDARRALFTFERRVGVPYSDNKYFSAAQMRTVKHLALLQKIEDLLSETPPSP